MRGNLIYSYTVKRTYINIQYTSTVIKFILKKTIFLALVIEWFVLLISTFTRNMNQLYSVNRLILYSSTQNYKHA